MRKYVSDKAKERGVKPVRVKGTHCEPGNLVVIDDTCELWSEIFEPALKRLEIERIAEDLRKKEIEEGVSDRGNVQSGGGFARRNAELRTECGHEPKHHSSASRDNCRKREETSTCKMTVTQGTPRNSPASLQSSPLV
jgi:hypothetical protein